MIKFKKILFSATPSALKKGTVAILCMVMIGLLAVGCKKDNEKKDDDSNSNTIVNDGSSWATLSYGLASWGVPCYIFTQYVYLAGDSTITSVSYKKVFSCNDRLHKNIKYEGLIREQEQKTYFIPANSDTEYLLYDFSLEEGMSFNYKFWMFGSSESETFYVSSVDSVMVNGLAKKRIQIKTVSYADWTLDTWIEEIGSLSGILNPCYRNFLDGAVKNLLCYYQNNQLAYKNSTYPECYYDKPEEIMPFIPQPNIGVSVYPNPIHTDAQLTVSSPNEIISSVKLVDISADEIIYNNENINSNSFSVDVSALLNGFYGLSVWLKNGQGGDFIVYKE